MLDEGSGGGRPRDKGECHAPLRVGFGSRGDCRLGHGAQIHVVIDMNYVGDYL